LNITYKEEDTMKQGSIILMLMLFIALIAGPSAADRAKEYGRHENYNEKFYGIVESMPEGGYEGEWVINGRRIQVGKDTYIKEKRGKAALGAYVEVKGKQAGDEFAAYKIEVEGSVDNHKSPYPGKFYGTVEHMPDTGREGIWIVNGREILVTNSTKIEEEHGKAEAGVYVEVEGNYSGKTFTAYEIEIKGERGYREYDPSRKKTYERKYQDYSQHRKKFFNSKFAGTIENIPEAGYEGLWIIDGRKVKVNNKTLIDETDGRVSVGAYTKVKGIRTGDTITAHEIEIEQKEK
jgi:hypothetical protein